MKKLFIIFALLFAANIAMSNDIKKTNELKNEITVDIKTPLLIEDWMVDNTIWTANQKHIKHFNFRMMNMHKRFHHRHFVYECPLILEDWMLNSELFFN